MKKFTRKIVVSVLSALCMLFMMLGCMGVVGINAKAETTVVNLTYKSMQYQNNEVNAGKYWTSICFYPDTGDGVSTGNPDGAIAFDFSDLLANTTYTGSENTVSYLPAVHWGWTADFKSSTFCFIYLRTANMPAAGDTVQMKKGAWFVTGGSIDDKYVLAEDINLKFNGTIWETYTPPVETTKVTFTNINSSWNDNTDILNNGMHYTVIHLAGLQTSGYLGQSDDWSDKTYETPQSLGDEGLHFMHCLESNPVSSLQTPELSHSVGSKRPVSRLERRAESFASPRDEACLQGESGMQPRDFCRALT